MTRDRCDKTALLAWERWFLLMQIISRLAARVIRLEASHFVRGSGVFGLFEREARIIWR